MAVVVAGQRFRSIEKALELAGDGAPEALAIIADPNRPAEQVARALTAHGAPISPSSIRTYRRLVRQTGDIDK